MYRYIDLDTAREALIDYTYPLVGYKCEHCENVFFTYEDDAKVCPFCKTEVKPLYDWNVELLDWGFKKRINKWEGW